MLSRTVMEEQLANKWPGLGQEAKQICQELSIPDITMTDVSKRTIKEAVRFHHYQELYQRMAKYKTMNKIKSEDLQSGMKDYMKVMTVADVRTNFRIRTNMLDLLANMNGKVRDGNLKCRGCMVEGSEESQVHVLYCEAYMDLRTGREMESDVDLVNFFREVMRRRANENKTRGL